MNNSWPVFFLPYPLQRMDVQMGLTNGAVGVSLGYHHLEEDPKTSNMWFLVNFVNPDILSRSVLLTWKNPGSLWSACLLSFSLVDCFFFSPKPFNSIFLEKVGDFGFATNTSVSLWGLEKEILNEDAEDLKRLDVQKVFGLSWWSKNANNCIDIVFLGGWVGHVF